MHKSLALIAAFILCCFASFAQSQPQTSQGSSQDDVSVPPLTVPQRDYSEVLKSGHGEIVIWIKVRKDGGVNEPLALYNEPVSMNFANKVHPELERSALNAVKGWKFPPVFGGVKPLEFRTLVVLPFSFQNPEETLQNSLAEAAPSASASGSGGKAPYGALGKIWLDQGVADTLQIRHVEPEYPRMAKIAHIQGDVVVLLRISKEGHVADANAVSGHPLLVQATMDAIKQWEYRPVMVNGQPVEIQSKVTAKFRIP